MILNDADLAYIQRVLESNAPASDRVKAAALIRDIRRYNATMRRIRDAMANHAEPDLGEADYRRPSPAG